MLVFSLSLLPASPYRCVRHCRPCHLLDFDWQFSISRFHQLPVSSSPLLRVFLERLHPCARIAMCGKETWVMEWVVV